MTTRKRKGMAEYRRERHGTMFTLPAAEKARLNDFAEREGETIRGVLITALNMLYISRAMPPVNDE